MFNHGCCTKSEVEGGRCPKISTSVFVTNLLDLYIAKDLWNTFKTYGHVVDAYISDRRSKAGKSFGFVRFINVFDVERLVTNLCTVWVGNFKIHANVARFQRDSVKKTQQAYDKGSKVDNEGGNKNGNILNNMANSYAHVVKRPLAQKENFDDDPTMVLDETCLNKDEFPFCLLGKVREFASLTNLKSNESVGSWFSQIIQAHNDFILEERVIWVEIEGVPCKWWSKNTFNRIASRWGTILNAEELEEGGFHSSRLCICTKSKTAVFESFKMVYRGKFCWVRAIEVSGWVPDFEEDCEDEYESNDGAPFKDLEGESDIEEVSETRFEDEPVYNIGEDNSVVSNNVDESQTSPTYPPGFTPNDAGVTNVNASNVVVEEPRQNEDQEEGEVVGIQSQTRKDAASDAHESTCYGYIKKSNGPRTGGSILQCIEDLVHVGANYGIRHDGMHEKYKRNHRITRSDWRLSMNFVSLNIQGLAQKAKKDWLKKSCVSMSDYFVMVRGVWVPSGKSLLIISIYAPQELSEKRMLWDYLRLAICNWDGDVVAMGYFNEMRDSSERFGSVFNKQGAKVFNDFIANAGLVEVPFGGCSFTWCHKFASKMSKLDRFLISDSLLCACPSISSVSLDRYLSDHRPILMRESHYDYGPTPFKFYHYGFEFDGFDKFVEDSWKEIREHTYGRMSILKSELINLDSVFDKGGGVEKDVHRRPEIVRNIQELEKTEAMETAQKAKIKWAVEGDENSKYYHGVINKKRGNLAIRGVLVDGNWVESHSLVKNAFYDHFKCRFEQPCMNGILLDREFTNIISSDQAVDLESAVSKEEIKRAVWDCGINKSPGPDGFTFGFYRRY
nr:RNA-directed DNA polymerase, eukaryota [Tanacetum cinerariifolium]